jgi:hypothetical protein
VRKQHGGEHGRIEAFLARQSAEDRDFLEPRLLPPWLVRRRRLEVRNQLIVAARPVFSGDRRSTYAAKDAARALAGYSGNWRRELPEGVSRRHQMQHAILRAGDGKVIGWRRIAEIWATARNAGVAASRGAQQTQTIPRSGRDRDRAD